MEEMVDEPDDIFDEYEALDENGDEGENGEVEAHTTVNEAEAGEVIPVPKKRIVRNPRVKFNPDRLCGERGIPVLIDHFKNMTFKGAGHETEDLDRLLSAYEHWTHRLYPSMKFSDCLRQIERLGKKRPVQTCLTKIRLGMPILSADFIGGDEEEEDNVQRGLDSDPETTNTTEFDRLIEDYRQTVPDEHRGAAPSEDPPSSTENASEAFVSNCITEEQRIKMEQNRKLAAERLQNRLSNLNAALAGTSSPFTSNESATFTTGASILASHNEIINGPRSHDDSDDEDVNFNSVMGRKPIKKLKINSDDEEDIDIDALVDNSSSQGPNSIENGEGFPKTSMHTSLHNGNSLDYLNNKLQNDAFENGNVLERQEDFHSDEDSSSPDFQEGKSNSGHGEDMDSFVSCKPKKKYRIDSDDDTDEMVDRNVTSGLTTAKDDSSINGISRGGVSSLDSNTVAVGNSSSQRIIPASGSMDIMEKTVAIGDDAQNEKMEDPSHYSDSDDEVLVNKKPNKKCRIDSDDEVLRYKRPSKKCRIDSDDDDD